MFWCLSSIIIKVDVTVQLNIAHLAILLGGLLFILNIQLLASFHSIHTLFLIFLFYDCLECNIFERITQYNIALLSFSEGIGTNICHKRIIEHDKICQKFKFRIMAVILLCAEVSSFQIVVDHI